MLCSYRFDAELIQQRYGRYLTRSATPDSPTDSFRHVSRTQLIRRAVVFAQFLNHDRAFAQLMFEFPKSRGAKLGFVLENSYRGSGGCCWDMLVERVEVQTELLGIPNLTGEGPAAP